MKTVYSKIVFLATAFFTLFAVSAGAQTLLTAPTANTPVTFDDWVDFKDEDPDVVTVGSLMPYKMDITELLGTGVALNLSYEYKWLFRTTGGTPATLPPRIMPTTAITGTTLPNPLASVPPTPATYWYKEHVVTVSMPETAGSVELTTNVRYLFNGQVLCPPDEADSDKKQNITVVAKPKIAWADGITDKEWVFCLEDTYTIPATTVILTGGVTTNPQFEVNYTVKFTPFAFDTGSTKPTTEVNQWVGLNDFSLVFPAVTFDEPGIYEIEILNITDRISRKSLIPIQGDVSGVDGKFNVTVLPRANDLNENLPVQHVPNVPL